MRDYQTLHIDTDSNKGTALLCCSPFHVWNQMKQSINKIQDKYVFEKQRSTKFTNPREN
jgi:hypothetical protein